MEKCLEDVLAPLVERTLAWLSKYRRLSVRYHPPVPSQLLARVDPTAGDAWGYTPLPQGLAAAGEIVGFVGVQLLRTLLRGLPGFPRGGRLIGSMPSTTSSRTFESWTFAAL
jgi:hypothetical protein